MPQQCIFSTFLVPYSVTKSSIILLHCISNYLIMVLSYIKFEGKTSTKVGNNQRINWKNFCVIEILLLWYRKYWKRYLDLFQKWMYEWTSKEGKFDLYPFHSMNLPFTNSLLDIHVTCQCSKFLSSSSLILSAIKVYKI